LQKVIETKAEDAQIFAERFGGERLAAGGADRGWRLNQAPPALKPMGL
jgi:hypothetical protein